MTQTFKKQNQIRTFTIKDGKVLAFINNVANPTIEQMYQWGWVDYEYPTVEPYEPTYDEKLELLVETKIRRKYSINLEFHANRKREEDPEKFNIYTEYVEKCILEAKKELE